MVITFSRQFPGYHPRKGEPTRFAEKILNYIHPAWNHSNYFNLLVELNRNRFRDGFDASTISKFYWEDLQGGIIDTKHHTIRAGGRWKVGDWFSPRVWSGKPYHSPQITFAPDIAIKKVFKFEIVKPPKNAVIYVNDKLLTVYNEFEKGFIGTKTVAKIAKNDGLSFPDFLDWFKFPQPFSGQIIAWDENVNY